MNDNIVIFRNEELYKVLLHECIHYFNLINCEDSNIFFDKDYAIYSKMGHLFTETFVETFANLINVILISETSDNLKINLQKEIDFCYTQVGKILNHAGYSNWNEYFKPNNTDEDKKIIETTNMHAYFILRSQSLYKLK